MHLLFINTIDDSAVTDFMRFQKDGICMTLSCTADYYVNFDLIGRCSAGVSVCPEHILTNCVLLLNMFRLHTIDTCTCVSHTLY